MADQWTLQEVLPSAEPGPSEAALASERQEALILCEWEELPVAEAADVLQTTAKEVESRLYRARRMLRERLKQWL